MNLGDTFRDLLITFGVAAGIALIIYVLKQRSKPEFVLEMTYKDAIGYFATNQSLDERIQKGAMYRQPHPCGFVFTQAFLDQTDSPVLRPDGQPYGRRLIVGHFDSELNSTFGNKNVIIVE